MYVWCSYACLSLSIRKVERERARPKTPWACRITGQLAWAGVQPQMNDKLPISHVDRRLSSALAIPARPAVVGGGLFLFSGVRWGRGTLTGSHSGRRYMPSARPRPAGECEVNFVRAERRGPATASEPPRAGRGEVTRPLMLTGS